MCLCGHDRETHGERRMCLMPRCSCATFVQYHRNYRHQFHARFGIIGRIYSLSDVERGKKHYVEV